MARASPGTPPKSSPVTTQNSGIAACGFVAHDAAREDAAKRSLLNQPAGCPEARHRACHAVPLQIAQPIGIAAAVRITARDCEQRNRRGPFRPAASHIKLAAEHSRVCRGISFDCSCKPSARLRSCRSLRLSRGLLPPRTATHPPPGHSPGGEAPRPRKGLALRAISKNVRGLLGFPPARAEHPRHAPERRAVFRAPLRSEDSARRPPLHEPRFFPLRGITLGSKTTGRSRRKARPARQSRHALQLPLGCSLSAPPGG